ncbi:hypothetical protein C8J57DRAFT_1505154 [Mycena rebaudengoi]|nr:hypothetical protein C8J57DRAFT_1505154 [Mycena rebaudengoi]
MSPPPVVTFVLGGWDLATHADLILQGLLFTQFAKYMSRYRSDRLWNKLFVLGLCIATTAKSAHAITLVWFQNVEYFLNLEQASKIYAIPSLGRINLLLAAVIPIYVQAYFTHRLWLISKNIYVVSCLIVLFLFSLIAAFLTAVYAYPRDSTNTSIFRNGIWILVQVVAVVGGDILLCASTIYFLLRQSRGELPGTVGTIHRLIRLIFQSAALAALCAVFGLICDIWYYCDGRIDGMLLLLIISNMMLPKLYATSIMWTLNSRQEIDSHFSAEIVSGSEKFSNRQQPMTTTMGTIRFDRRSEELGRPSSVRTHSGGVGSAHDSVAGTTEISEHGFGPSEKPYPADINRPESSQSGSLGP